MRTDWILFALLGILWLAAGGIPWPVLTRGGRGQGTRSKDES